MKECPRKESFADGSVGTGIRMLPVRGSERMSW